MQLYYLNWRDIPDDEWHWPHFHPSEIACGGPGRPTPNEDILINHEALDRLEQLRVLLGAPIVLNSAYRNPIYNAKVGGADRSKHTMGIAFDIRHSHYYSVKKLHIAAKSCGFRGFGFYPSFTHIDLGKERTW